MSYSRHQSCSSFSHSAWSHRSVEQQLHVVKLKELFDSSDQLDREFTVIFSRLWQDSNPGISTESEVIVFD